MGKISSVHRVWLPVPGTFVIPLFKLAADSCHSAFTEIVENHRNESEYKAYKGQQVDGKIRAGTDRYQLLFFAYRHPLAGEDPGLLSPGDYSNFNAMFGEHSPVEVSCRLHGLRPGTYQLCRTLLNSYHGSFLDVLIAGYQHSTIDPLDYYQYFMRYRNARHDDSGLFSSPEERIIYLRSDGTLMIRSTVTAHSVAMWEIRLQR